MDKITILLEWDSCQPDNRQYKQPSQVLLPKVLVAVNVPLEHTYFHNSEDMIQAQISGGNVVAPILTPKGMRYIVDQLEVHFQDDESITADDFKNADDGWGDEDGESDDPTWDDNNAEDNNADDTEGWGDEDKTEKEDDFSKGADFDVDEEWD